MGALGSQLMPAAGRVVLLGKASRLAACAPALEGIVAVPFGDNPPDAELTIVVAPEELPAGELPRATLAWLDTGEAAAEWLAGPGPDGFDRVIASDPGDHAVWRSLPLPVADSLFVDDVPAGLGGEVVDLGPDGPPDDELDAALREQGLALESGNGALTHRSLRALAAGAVLIRGPLEATRGLEAGLDFLELRDPQEVPMLVGEALRSPTAVRALRLRGRAKAEIYRASRVFPRLVADLQADVTSGRGR
jgi:hypothetical protein